MLNCYTSTHSVYFEGGFHPSFQDRYNGVIVNARSEGGYGHFAIRLEKVGYKFSVETEDDVMTLHFEYPEFDDK